MKIMFEDLTYKAQRRLLAKAGVKSPSEMGWDIGPVAIVDLDGESGDRCEDDFADDIYDCGF